MSTPKYRVGDAVKFYPTRWSKRGLLGVVVALDPGTPELVVVRCSGRDYVADLDRIRHKHPVTMEETTS